MKQSGAAYITLPSLIGGGVALLLGGLLWHRGGLAANDVFATHLIVSLIFLAALAERLRRSWSTDAPHLLPFITLAGAMLLLFGVSLAYSVALYDGVLRTLTVFDALLLFMSCSWLFESPQAPRRLLLVLLPVGVLTLVGVFFYSWLRADLIVRSSGALFNPNNLAALLECFIFFPIAAIILKVGTHEQQRLWRIALVITTAALLLTFSRAGIVATGISLFLLMRPLADRTRSAKTDRIWGAAFLLGLCFLAGAHFVNSKATAASLAMRREIMETAWRIWLSAPWSGRGIGSFAQSYLEFSRVDTTQYSAVYAHSDYLQLAAETGLVSLLLALAALVWTIRRGIRQIGESSHRQRFVATGALCSIAALALHSLLDFNLQLPLLLLLAAVLAAYCWRQPTEKPAQQTATTTKRPLVACLIFVSAAIMLAPSLYIVAKSWRQAPLWNPNVRLQAAEARIGADLPTDAVSEATISFHLSPTAKSAWRLSQLFEQLGLQKNAETFLLFSLKYDPGNAAYQKVYAEYLLRRGRKTEALDAFALLLNRHPEFLEPTLPRLEESGVDPLQMASIIPNDAVSQKRWVGYLRSRRFVTAALKAAEEGATRFPDCAYGFAAAAAELRLEATDAKTDLKEAMAAVDQYAKQCPQEHPAAALLQARLAALKGDRAAALALLAQLLETEPASESALRQATDLAASSTETKIKEGWKNALEKLVERYPAQATLRYELSRLRAQQSDWAGAISLAKSLVSEHLHDIGYKRLLASLYRERRMYDQVFRLYRDIIAEDPKDIAAHLDLADAYGELHLQREAQQVLEKGLSYNPGNERLQEALNRLQPNQGTGNDAQ